MPTPIRGSRGKFSRGSSVSRSTARTTRYSSSAGFSISLARIYSTSSSFVQFSIQKDGEYDHMEQLHCEFKCKPTEALQDFETEVWSYDSPSLDEYLQKVESLPEFQASVSHSPWQCGVYQEQV